MGGIGICFQTLNQLLLRYTRGELSLNQLCYSKKPQLSVTSGTIWLISLDSGSTLYFSFQPLVLKNHKISTISLLRLKIPPDFSQKKFHSVNMIHCVFQVPKRNIIYVLTIFWLIGTQIIIMNNIKTENVYSLLKNVSSF